MSCCRICGGRIEPGQGVLDKQLNFEGETGELHPHCQFSDQLARQDSQIAGLREQVQLLSRALELFAARAPAARAYSQKPSAIRNRRMRGLGEFRRQPRQPGDASAPGFPSVEPVTSAVNKVTAAPPFVVPTAELPKHENKAPLLIPGFFFVQLYEHFRSVYRSCIGEKWYRREDVPFEERAQARKLLERTGTPQAACAAVDLYAKLWRDQETVRKQFRLSLRMVVWSLGKIHIANKTRRAHIPYPRTKARRAPAVAVAAPPPEPVARVMPKGEASVGAVLKRLKAKSVVAF